MSIDDRRARALLESVLAERGASELEQQLAPKWHPPAARIPGGDDATSMDARWAMLGPEAALGRDSLGAWDPGACTRLYGTTIENIIGTVQVPVGIAGPLRVNGLFAQGDYYVPLATTEGALIASHNRGARLVTEAGGCTVITTNEGVSRAPGFAFGTLYEAGVFVAWALDHLDDFRKAAAGTTQHGALKDMRVSVEGNHVYLILDYATGDAAGQNMVTIATQAVCDYIARECPSAIRYSFVEANHSGDKKASAQSFIFGRGRSVTAEVLVSGDLVRERLHTTPEMMANYWRMSAIGGVLSGTIGVEGHYANGIAALYLATGQDIACVAESAVGVTRLELDGDALYASVTLPNLVVGTVGGGTALPSQRACLGILGLGGAGHARALAEVCGAIALAGELSIVGALVANEFTGAHQRLGRARENGTAAD